MRAFRYSGITQSLVTQARATLRSPQYGHPAHLERATGYGPCRACLRTFDVGTEDRLLFTYQPFAAPGSLPAPGPVFVHAGECPRYDALEFPPELLPLPLVIEGFDATGHLVAQEWVGERAAEVVVREVFEWPAVEFVHLRNAEAGCFIARVEPVLVCN